MLQQTTFIRTAYLLFLLFATSKILADTTPIVLNNNLVQINLTQQALSYKDESGTVSFDAMFNSSLLTIHNNDNIYMGYGEMGAMWVSFSLKNESTRTTTFLLEIPNATINSIDFYRPNEYGEYKKTATGDVRKYAQRDFPTRYFTFQLEIPKGGSKTYYLRVEPQGDAINMPLIVWDSIAYIKNNLDEKYAYGLYYGVLIFIIVFHIFLYFKLKDITLIYYMLYVLGIAFLQLSFDGLTSKYILPFLPWLADRFIPASIFLSSGAVVFFIQQYLETKAEIPKYHKLLDVTKWINVTFFSITFLPIQLAYLLVLGVMNIIGILSIVIVVIGAFFMLKKQPRLARYFILAYGLLLFGVSFSVLQNMGYPTLISKYAIKLGSSSELIVLAFALAVRFKMIDDETQANLEATVEKRTAELRQSNKNVNDSIRYAKRIQYSLLPSPDALESSFADYFIFFQPKDVVSGDFYWHQEKNGKVLIAAADCTGHGVPGAFMSMLGSSLLKEIVNTQGVTSTSEILTKLDEGIISALKQDNNLRDSARDGMDIGLLCYDKENGMLEYSAARRPLLYFNNGELTTYKGSRFSIGGRKSEKNFSTDYIKIENGDIVYLFSDGYPDQFGGENDRKFMLKRLKELLGRISKMPMAVQQEAIMGAFNEWKGKYKQTDDILVMGLRF